MPLVRLSVENFRCFSRRQELEIRPITVVLGKNNSGKSALVRVPLVLSTGILTSLPRPFDLAQLGKEPPDFIDLVHKRLEHGNVSVGFEFDDAEGRVRIEATIQNIDEWQTQVVSHWAYRAGETALTLTWLTDDDEEDSDFRPYRAVAASGEPEQILAVRFNGLLPAAVDPPDDTVLAKIFDASERIRSGWDEVRHVDPFRTRPRRMVRPTSGRDIVGDDLDSGGHGALVRDHVRGGGRLIAKINEYLGAISPAGSWTWPRGTTRTQWG